MYRDEFLRESPNALPALLPRDEDMADVVKVINVSQVAPDRKLELVMDGEAQEALCFLR